MESGWITRRSLLLSAGLVVANGGYALYRWFYPQGQTLVTECQHSLEHLGVLAECLNCRAPHPNGEWPGQYLSTRTVAYSCGILAREGEHVVHRHDPAELQRCRQLSAEAGRLMSGVFIELGDESDHTLDPFFIASNVDDEAPARITEGYFRTAMRGVVNPNAQLRVHPLEESQDWFKKVSSLHPDRLNDPQEHRRVAQWRRFVAWFQNSKELRSPVYVNFVEPTTEPPLATVYPQFFLGLTPSGSLVGLVSCVVWT